MRKTNQHLLRNAKELKDAERWRKKIGIVPNLCKKYREKDRLLRVAVKQKRDKGKETG